MTSYPVKRPRLALSCLVCTRRKVRCGREQPHCSNCERLGETCVYNPGTRDPGTGRVLRAGDNEDSNDGEGPMPNTQKPGNHQSSLDMFFKAPEQGAPYDALALSRDRLSVRNAQFRYVGKSFWGFLNSHVCCVYHCKAESSSTPQERLTDSMFHDDNDQPDLPPSHISVTLLAKSLHLFPTKHASDALVQAFKVGVYTIFPLINIQKFRSDYDSFWACFDPNRAMTSPSSLVQDPTFTCLNFAVLFAGASVATESAWSVPELKGIERKGMIDRLEKACHDSLAACKYTEHPTLNTLAASLLVHHFTKHEPLAGAAFIASIVRLAQSMGLHQDHEEDNALIRESRRRIWWHVVWYDVQTSLATGLPTCCGDALEKVAND
jgi:Fungal Zn(2)-Cys(6) binuclear cluster domain./Fungal specific transcription factor domain.